MKLRFRKIGPNRYSVESAEGHAFFGMVSREGPVWLPRYDGALLEEQPTRNAAAQRLVAEHETKWGPL